MFDLSTLVKKLNDLGQGWTVNDDLCDWFDYENSDLGGTHFVKGGIIGRQLIVDYGKPRIIPVYKYKAHIDFSDGRVYIYEGRVHPGVKDCSNPNEPMWYYHLCLSNEEIQKATRES